MSVDYIVASLQPLVFGAPPPYTLAEFAALAGDVRPSRRWLDLEAEMRNAIAEERARAWNAHGGAVVDAAKWKRPVDGCSLYWTNRVRSAFAEKDPLRRDEALDRAFWDAAGELTPVASPLSRGALETYAVRLAIAVRRARRSTEAGNAVFDRITGEGV